MHDCVGFVRDLRTPGLSMAELWILNKSMPSDWTPEPLLNENHCSEISVLPPSPLLPLSVSSPAALSQSLALFLFSIALISLTSRPSPTREHAHMHPHMYTSNSFSVCICFVFSYLKIFLDGPMSDPLVTIHRGSACSICECHSRENCASI